MNHKFYPHLSFGLGIFAGILVFSTLLFGLPKLSVIAETIIRTIPTFSPLAPRTIEVDVPDREENLQNTLSYSSTPLILGLTVGSNNESVRTLQLILNTDPETRVANGNIPGAPGNETTYFGTKTAEALIKFQKKYQIDETGYVDQITLNALTIVMTQYLGSNGSPVPNQALNNQLVGQLAELGLGSLAEQAINNLKLVFSSSTVQQQMTDLVNRAVVYQNQAPAGNAYQTNPLVNYQNQANGTAPRVLSVSPDVVYDGDTVTITGVNFSINSSNYVSTGLETINVGSSRDGKTLSFQYKSELQRRADAEIAKAGSRRDQERARDAFREYNQKNNVQVQLTIQVSNEFGTSAIYGVTTKYK